MSAKPAKRAVIGKFNQVKRPTSRPRLVFEQPHIFRARSERSLPHLQESREFLPCVSCLQEAERRQDGLNRPASSYSRQEVNRPRSSEQERPSTPAQKKRPQPPSAADLERLSRPKSVPPSRLSNNCNWNNFIKKKSKYGMI